MNKLFKLLFLPFLTMAACIASSENCSVFNNYFPKEIEFLIINFFPKALSNDLSPVSKQFYKTTWIVLRPSLLAKKYAHSFFPNQLTINITGKLNKIFCPKQRNILSTEEINCVILKTNALYKTKLQYLIFKNYPKWEYSNPFIESTQQSITIDGKILEYREHTFGNYSILKIPSKPVQRGERFPFQSRIKLLLQFINDVKNLSTKKIILEDMVWGHILDYIEFLPQEINDSLLTRLNFMYIDAFDNRNDECKNFLCKLITIRLEQHGEECQNIIKTLITRVTAQNSCLNTRSNYELDTPFLFACRNNNSFTIDVLLQNEYVNIKKKTKFTKETALHLFCLHQKFDTEVQIPLLEKILGKKIIDVNAQDTKGNTALHNAVSNKNLDAALILLRYDADESKKNKDSETPLDIVNRFYLASFYSTNTDATQLTLEKVLQNIQYYDAFLR